MAVYYFHFRNEGRHSMPDLYGERLPDLTAARPLPGRRPAISPRATTPTAGAAGGSRWPTTKARC